MITIFNDEEKLLYELSEDLLTISVLQLKIMHLNFALKSINCFYRYLYHFLAIRTNKYKQQSKLTTSICKEFEEYSKQQICMKYKQRYIICRNVLSQQVVAFFGELFY